MIFFSVNNNVNITHGEVCTVMGVLSSIFFIDLLCLFPWAGACQKCLDWCTGQLLKLSP